MCWLCEEDETGSGYCQKCARMICFDIEAEDDICAPAYVTASGDLFCESCGRQHDEAEEQQAQEEGFSFDEEF